MMTKRKLAAELCKREGKKSQVAIGNVMETLSCLEDLLAEHFFAEDEDGPLEIIYINAHKKLEKLKKKAKK